MILESAQLLSTAVRIELDPEQVKQAEFDAQGLYKLTHKNHPCAIWTRQCSGNFWWVYSLAKQLCIEYTFRYGKTHKTESLINKMPIYHKQMPACILQPFIYCGNEELRQDNIIESYRAYYNQDKRDMARWTRREIPFWFEEK